MSRKPCITWTQTACISAKKHIQNISLICKTGSGVARTISAKIVRWSNVTLWVANKKSVGQ